MPIRACLFDLGNVLVFFSHDRMVNNMAAVSGADPRDIRRFLFDAGFQNAIETGQVTEDEFHRQFEAHTGTRVSADALDRAVGDIFELNAAMLPLLDELRTAGVRLVLLSNTCRSHIRFVRRTWDILDRFDALTTSWETGAMKPDARIYESALIQADCPASDCFYTDDIEDYVAAARSHGIQAHVFRDASTTRRILHKLGLPVTWPVCDRTSE